MQKLALISLAITLCFSYSAAKEKQQIEVPLNIGVGPALFWIPDVTPGINGKNLHPGAQIELYAVITPQVLQDNKNKIPKKYQKFVNTKEELYIAPIWLSLIPEYLVLSQGERSCIYGGIWSIFSMSVVLMRTEMMKFEAKATLPTLSYLYTHAGENDPDTQHLFGIGGMLKVENTIKFGEKFLATMAYGHNLNVPLETNTFTDNSSKKHSWIQTGVLSLVFHFRFNTMQNI